MIRRYGRRARRARRRQGEVLHRNPVLETTGTPDTPDGTPDNQDGTPDNQDGTPDSQDGTTPVSSPKSARPSDQAVPRTAN